MKSPVGAEPSIPKLKFVWLPIKDLCAFTETDVTITATTKNNFFMLVDFSEIILVK